jgi:hypothetical protein
MEQYGRHEGTRTPDLYRVKFRLDNLKPFACLAFPFRDTRKKPLKTASLGDELVTSFGLRRCVAKREGFRHAGSALSERREPSGLRYAPPSSRIRSPSQILRRRL